METQIYSNRQISSRQLFLKKLNTYNLSSSPSRKPSEHIAAFLINKPKIQGFPNKKSTQIKFNKIAQLKNLNILNANMILQYSKHKNSKINQNLNKKEKQENKDSDQFRTTSKSIYNNGFNHFKKFELQLCKSQQKYKNSQNQEDQRRPYTQSRSTPRFHKIHLQRLQKIIQMGKSNQDEGLKKSLKSTTLKNHQDPNNKKLQIINNINKTNKNHQFLRRGSTVQKKIISSIIRKKLDTHFQVNQKFYQQQNDGALNTQLQKLIPLGFQDVIGQGQILRMAKIFKGISTKDIQIDMPKINKKTVRQYKIKGMNMVDQQQAVQMANEQNTITGWEM